VQIIQIKLPLYLSADLHIPTVIKAVQIIKNSFERMLKIVKSKKGKELEN
jgi:hypothetical protein